MVILGLGYPSKGLPQGPPPQECQRHPSRFLPPRLIVVHVDHLFTRYRAVNHCEGRMVDASYQ